MYSGLTQMEFLLGRRSTLTTSKTFGRVNGSFIDVISGFIQSVNTMESTVLVPTLLKDINLDGVTWLPTLLAKGNCRQLFDIYCLVKRCKNHFTEIALEDEDVDYIESSTAGNYKQKRGKQQSAKNSPSSSSFLLYSLDGDVVVNIGNPETRRSNSTRVGTGNRNVSEDEMRSSSVSSTSMSSSSSASMSPNRKQKISLDSGNWSMTSTTESIVDDDFDCDSSDAVTPSSGHHHLLLDDIHSSSSSNHSNHSHPGSPLPVPRLIRATSTNLRNLKALFSHLKEVADFVTQQYLQALQLI